MPRGDRTGPQGMGAMTGRAAGYCAGSKMPGFAAGMPGSGYGQGRGTGNPDVCGRGPGGRGWRNMYFATGQPRWNRAVGSPDSPTAADPDRERRALKNQLESLTLELERIKSRLAGIDSRGTDK